MNCENTFRRLRPTNIKDPIEIIVNSYCNIGKRTNLKWWNARPNDGVVDTCALLQPEIMVHNNRTRYLPITGARGRDRDTFLCQNGMAIPTVCRCVDVRFELFEIVCVKLFVVAWSDCRYLNLLWNFLMKPFFEGNEINFHVCDTNVLLFLFKSCILGA